MAASRKFQIPKSKLQISYSSSERQRVEKFSWAGSRFRLSTELEATLEQYHVLYFGDSATVAYTLAVAVETCESVAIGGFDNETD